MLTSYLFWLITYIQYIQCISLILHFQFLLGLGSTDIFLTHTLLYDKLKESGQTKLKDQL